MTVRVHNVRFPALLVLLGVVALAALPAGAVESPAHVDFVGRWQGALAVGEAQLRLVFDLHESIDGALEATLDSPDQSATGIPVPQVWVECPSIRLGVGALGAVYAGRLSDQTNAIEGEWRQSGKVLSLKLERVEEAPLLPAATDPLGSPPSDHVLGDWFGVLSTPAGELTLIVTIMEGEGGALRAELESRDQAPGKKIAVSSITATADHLSLAIQVLAATYEGNWIEAEQHWSGSWTQGGKLPLALRRGAPPAKPVVAGLDGLWEGTVDRNGVGLRLVLRVQTGERGTDVNLDSPDLIAYNLPVTTFSRNDDVVSFTVPSAAVRFEGTLSDNHTHLTGLWARPDRPDAEVTFVRTGTTSKRQARHRPQTPKEPFGYRVEEVQFENPLADGVTLAGTLTLPEGIGPFPTAILISGSGPQDRDEALLDHKPFAVLADHLTRSGIAVLRYDDRGFGRSTGDHSAATSADFATDANAAARYLLTRPEIDRGATGFIGHSEGGMVAPIAAVDNGEIAFIVLLAAPGTNLTQILRSQRRLMGLLQGVSEQELARTDPVVAGIFAAVAAASSREDAQDRVRALLTPEVLATLGVAESQKSLAVQEFGRDWFRYLLQYDPAAFLSRIHVPVLALNGSLDQQVPADENLAAIAAALERNPDFTIRKLDRLNHLFQTAETGAVGEYADIPETFSPVALEVVSNWINARVGADRQRHQGVN